MQQPYKISILVTAITLLGCFAVKAQTTEIFGRVIDATTKQPIPKVNIKLYGSWEKANTDAKGEFHIWTKDNVDSISFSSIGYARRTVTIIRGKEQQINIELGSDELKLTEIMVKANQHKKRVIDTAARYVYYQVLQNKHLNRSENIEAYKYDCYEKLQIALLNPRKRFTNLAIWRPFHFIFENIDTTEQGNVAIPGIVKETISKVYYRKHPHTTRKVIISDVLSGIDNPSLSKMAQYQFEEVNAYDNLFVINYTSFISPFSPAGINTYYYYLTDTQKIEGRISYKLYFVGKVREDLALKGYAWIDSATWAIRAINFRPNEKSNFNFINDYTIKQDFTFVDDQYWLMSREELRSVGSLLKRKSAFSILVTKVNDRRNISTQVDVHDTIFKKADEEIVLDDARNKPKTFWDTSRFEPLTPAEVEVYHIADTLRKVPAWKAYQMLGIFLTRFHFDAGPLSIGRVLNFVSRNNVEGWRLRFGFETNPRFQHPGTPANNFLRRFYFNGYVAYGLKDRIFQYMGTVRIMLPHKNDKWQAMEAMYRYDMRVPGQDDDGKFLNFDNIITAAGGKIFSKIQRVREAKFSYEKDWVRGFSSTLSINDKIYYGVPGVFDYSRTQEGVTVPVPHFNVTEFTIDSRYSFKDQYYANFFYRYFQTTKYPVFMFKYTAGLAEVGGDYFHYHNLLFTIKQRLNSPIGHTTYTFRLGKIFGKAPYPSCYITQGDLGVFLNKTSYNLIRDFEFISDRYVSLWVEHHFDGFFFNKIPGFNKLRLREVISFKGLLGDFSRKNADVLVTPAELKSPSPLPYMEAGFGIENIALLLRIDFLWRLTYRDLAGASTWGIKISIQPQF